MELNIQATEIYELNYDADTKIVINRGGTRSSKTYSLLQLLLVLSFERKGINIAICRKTFPALRLSALNDFISMLAKLDITNLFHYHKTERTFTNKQTGSKIYFLALDNPQKIRSVAFDYVHLEEANELPFETFRQIILRLKPSGRIYISFNPSDSNVWINTEIEQKRDDYTLIKSSYKDNAFLQPEQVAEIEYLKETDKAYWQIFGLGEYGVLSNIIYPDFEIIDYNEFKTTQGENFAGLDYGYVDATAGVHCKYKDGTVYVNEFVYKSYMNDIAKGTLEHLKAYKLNSAYPIYADHRPEINQTLRNGGYMVINAQKDITDGIDFTRKFKLKITKQSVNLLREIRKYIYLQDVNGRVTDTPIDFDNHALDAMRYAIYSHLRMKVFVSGLKTNN